MRLRVITTRPVKPFTPSYYFAVFGRGDTSRLLRPAHIVVAGKRGNTLCGRHMINATALTEDRHGHAATFLSSQFRCYKCEAIVLKLGYQISPISASNPCDQFRPHRRAWEAEPMALVPKAAAG